VKVTGLGIDAALAGVTADDPALADTRGLARLLYAALTAHWPGDEWPSLPPAPQVDGHPRSPRQVRAGVPAAIDEITCQALLHRVPTGGQPITSPAMLATALARVIPGPPAPPPMSSRPFTAPVMGPTGTGGPAGARHATAAYWDGNGGRGLGVPDTVPPTAPRPMPRAMLAAVTLLVVAVAAAGGWVLTHRGGGAAGGSAQAGQHLRSASHQVQVLKPVGASGFDPLSTSAQDPSNENSSQAQYAIDPSPRSAWHTQWYATARFGSLKAGTGLVLDMGRAVRLSSVKVTFGTASGANVRIELGNSDTRSPATLGSFKTVAKANNVVGAHTFAVSSAAEGRYVLIWFTKLPPHSSGQFEAAVFNVIVRGSH
jgi:hypothetical protein